MPVLIVGSIALDTVKTPAEEHADLLGGSASYAAVSASFFGPTQLVGIVGDDFPKAHVEYFAQRGIDLAGLQQVPGQSFRWSGEYMLDMNTRETRSVALNVFEHFTPHLPESFRQTPHVLLANIAPALQSHVLDQMTRPRFVVADTMDLWITIAREDLLKLLRRVDLLILNDSEARLLTDEPNLIKAAALIRALGPRFVAIKKGEHGCLLFGDPATGEFFACPAFPLANLHDPTGAGDCFAGGFIGHLAQKDAADGNHAAPVGFDALRQAVVFGSVLASFNVEAFSLERLRSVTEKDVQKRFEEFRRFSQF
ncbi:MAG: sugar kinase [Verrucomicrobia bacterium]|nr:sugar kinase [Verrucomicrobiota bacterium]MBV9656755.1 sugar kinase [Verrucomicrobiota bacterium]